uniref:Uncharacterized protein n=1 Tax=Arundo donax TaxID=35708 RepID=A0A0A9CEE9_ARUDO
MRSVVHHIVSLSSALVAFPLQSAACSQLTAPTHPSAAQSLRALDPVA